MCLAWYADDNHSVADEEEMAKLINRVKAISEELDLRINICQSYGNECSRGV